MTYSMPQITFILGSNTHQIHTEKGEMGDRGGEHLGCRGEEHQQQQTTYAVEVDELPRATAAPFNRPDGSKISAQTTRTRSGWQ